jgi:hypothetical protein
LALVTDHFEIGHSNVAGFGGFLLLVLLSFALFLLGRFCPKGTRRACLAHFSSAAGLESVLLHAERKYKKSKPSSLRENVAFFQSLYSVDLSDLWPLLSSGAGTSLPDSESLYTRGVFNRLFLSGARLRCTEFAVDHRKNAFVSTWLASRNQQRFQVVSPAFHNVPLAFDAIENLALSYHR